MKVSGYLFANIRRYAIPVTGSPQESAIVLSNNMIARPVNLSTEEM